MNTGQFDSAMLESMLVRLIRTPEALQEAVQILRVEHFKLPEEQQYALLWKSILELYSRHGEITFHSLYDTILLTASQIPNFPEPILAELLSETGDDNSAGLVVYAFRGVKVAEMHIDLTRQYLKQFLGERYVYAPLAASLANGMAVNLPQILSEASERHQRVMQVDRYPVESALPDNWMERSEPREVESTGVDFLDAFTDGGHAPGDTNGLLGPMGVGKTTMAVTLLVGVGNIQLNKRDKLRAEGQPVPNLKISYFVTYEQSKRDVQILLRANAASILTSRLSELRDPLRELSSCARGDFQPYETAVHRQRYKEDWEKQVMSGEYERLMACRELLRDGIQIIDLSGSGEQSRTGDGFVEEVAALISMDQQRRGNPGVAVVVVDYVLLAVKRHLHANNQDEDRNLRHSILSYADRTKLQVAGKFKTPVWLLQQLNNDGNKGDPTKVTSHTQAAEGSAFAAPLVYCASLGTKDQTSSCTLINFSKTRRSGGLPQPKIIYINGAMARMEDGDGRYAIDYNARRIRLVSDLQQITGTVQTVASPGSQAATLSAASRIYTGATPQE